MTDYKPMVDFRNLDSYSGFSVGQRVEPNDCYARNFGYVPEVRKGGFVKRIEEVVIGELRTVIVKLKDGRTFNPCFLQPVNS